MVQTIQPTMRRGKMLVIVHVFGKEANILLDSEPYLNSYVPNERGFLVGRAKRVPSTANYFHMW